MGGPPNLETWSPRQHRRQPPMTPWGAVSWISALQSGDFYLSDSPLRSNYRPPMEGRPIACETCAKPYWGGRDCISQPLAWVCAGDGRAISDGRLVCDRPTHHRCPVGRPPPSLGVVAMAAWLAPLARVHLRVRVCCIIRSNSPTIVIDVGEWDAHHDAATHRVGAFAVHTRAWLTYNWRRHSLRGVACEADAIPGGVASHPLSFQLRPLACLGGARWLGFWPGRGC